MTSRSSSPNILSEVLATSTSAAVVPHEPEPVAAQRPPAPEPPDVIDVTVEALSDPRDMALQRSLPRTVAMLVVQRCGESEFKVLGFHESGRLRWNPDASPWRRPGFNLATVARSMRPQESGQALEIHAPRELFQLYREWSRVDAQELRQWINLLREHVHDLNLWIADTTPFEIPWELLFLSPAGSQASGFLGALLPVARWQKVNEPVRDIGEPADCSGRAIAYMSPDLVECAIGFEGIPRLADLDGLRGALRRDRDDLALVYVTAYGHHSRHFTKVTIQSRDGREVLALGDLSSPEELLVFQGTKAVVFLNACHSGRPVDDPLLNSPYLRGFVEIFLQRGACGVIGTLGEVDATFSASIASQLMEAFTGGDEGVPVAAALRDLRAVMAPDVSDAEVQVESVRAFMYVYYGHPLTRLRVISTGEAER